MDLKSDCHQANAANFGVGFSCQIRKSLLMLNAQFSPIFFSKCEKSSGAYYKDKRQTVLRLYIHLSVIIEKGGYLKLFPSYLRNWNRVTIIQGYIRKEHQVSIYSVSLLLFG